MVIYRNHIGTVKTEHRIGDPAAPVRVTGHTFYSVNNLTKQTNSTTLVDAHVFTTGHLSPGTYRIEAYTTTNVSQTTRGVNVALVVDGTIVYTTQTVVNSVVSTRRDPVAMMVFHQFTTGGPKTIALRFSSTATTSTVYMYASHISVERRF